MYPYTIKNAIDEEFRNYVLNFVEVNFSNFRENNRGPGRYFMAHIQDDVIENEKVKLAHKFGIHNWEPEPVFGNFIGCNFEGAFVHPHRDPSVKEGYTHVRINIMASKPEHGGDPIIDGEIINVEEKDSWLCISSKQMHQTNPVIGAKIRIVPSLGLLVKNENLTFLK